MQGDEVITAIMKSLVFTLISTLLITNGAVLAQNTNQEMEEQQWYQIEVLIFAYQETANNTTEIWPKALGLKYPDRIVELKKASQHEVMLNNWHSNAEIPEPEPSATKIEVLAEDITEPLFLAESSQAEQALPEALLVAEPLLAEPLLAGPSLKASSPEATPVELTLPEPLLPEPLPGHLERTTLHSLTATRA